MFLPLFPLEIFDELIKFFKDISSSFWDSNVVDDKELESPEVFEDSFFDEVSLDLHLDFPFSGGVIDGTVRVLDNESGSNETVEMDCSRDWLGPCIFNVGESGEIASPGIAVGF